MAKPVICGLCKAAMRKGEKLKPHWKVLHPEEYVKRKVWLGEHEGKLRAAVMLAADGLKGGRPGDEANLGPEARVDQHERRRQQAEYVKHVNAMGVNEDDEQNYPEEEE